MVSLTPLLSSDFWAISKTRTTFTPVHGSLLALYPVRIQLTNASHSARNGTLHSKDTTDSGPCRYDMLNSSTVSEYGGASTPLSYKMTLLSAMSSYTSIFLLPMTVIRRVLTGSSQDRCRLARISLGNCIVT